MNLGAMRHAIVLGLFCFGFGVVLALTNQVTLDDITQRATEDRLNSLAQVLPAELYDASPLDNVVSITDAEGRETRVFRARKGDRITGVAYEIRGSGYAGEIRLMMGVDAEGRILGAQAVGASGAALRKYQAPAAMAATARAMTRGLRFIEGLRPGAG